MFHKGGPDHSDIIIAEKLCKFPSKRRYVAATDQCQSILTTSEELISFWKMLAHTYRSSRSCFGVSLAQDAAVHSG